MNPSLGKRKRQPDSSDDEEVAPGRQILPVANLPADFSGPPIDGMQYLFTVRRDARKLPDVTRVPNPYQSKQQPVPMVRSLPVGSHPMLPSPEWRTLFETRFRNFRKNISQPTISVGIPTSTTQKLMPDKQERDSWWAFLAGKPEPEWNPPKQNKKLQKRKEQTPLPYADAEANDETWRVDDQGEVELVTPKKTTESSEPPSALIPREPTQTLLQRIDQPMALHLIMYFAHWLNLYFDQKLPPLNQAHGRWIFALLARIDDHITADDMNQLRNLTRATIRLLKVRFQGDTDVGDAMDISACWLIISTVVGIWGQKDLWMDAEDMLNNIQLPSPDTVP